MTQDITSCCCNNNNNNNRHFAATTATATAAAAAAATSTGNNNNDFLAKLSSVFWAHFKDKFMYCQANEITKVKYNKNTRETQKNERKKKKHNCIIQKL